METCVSATNELSAAPKWHCYATLRVVYRSLNPQPSTLNPQPSTLNPLLDLEDRLDFDRDVTGEGLHTDG